MHILFFPDEIHEKILGYLDIADLAAATKSCETWRRIGNDRLVKRWCLKNISPDVLNEITENQFPGLSRTPSEAVAFDGFDWVNLCTKWARTAYVAPGSGSGSVNAEVESVPLSPLMVMKSCACAAVSGDVIILGDHANNVVWYDSCGEKIAQKGNFGEPVVALGLLNLCLREQVWSRYGAQHDAVIAVSHEFIAIYSMPTWNCQELYYLNVRHGTKSISAQGNHFAYYNSNQNVMTVCVVLRQPASECDSSDNMRVYPWVIQVKSSCAFATKNQVLNWKLWKNSVVCLLLNGTVMTYDMDSETASQSIFISEFLYPFDCFLCRGLIFCNISSARALLNYWHVNTGGPHWLVSTDGQTFRRMKTTLHDGDEISTINIKRTVIVAGTIRGKICIYRHTGSEHEIPDVMLRGPTLAYKIASTPIYNCDFSLDGENMNIVAKTTAHTLLLMKLPLMESWRSVAR